MACVTTEEPRDYKLGNFLSNTIYKFGLKDFSVYNSNTLIYHDTNRHILFFTFLKENFRPISSDIIYTYINDSLHNFLTDDKTSYFLNIFSRILRLHPMLTAYNYQIIMDELLAHIYKQYITTSIKYSEAELSLIFSPIVSRTFDFNKPFHKKLNNYIMDKTAIEDRINKIYVKYTSFLNEYNHYEGTIITPMQGIYNTVKFIKKALDLVYSSSNKLTAHLSINERITLIPVIIRDSSYYLQEYDKIRIVNPLNEIKSTDDQIMYKILASHAYHDNDKKAFIEYYKKAYSIKKDFSESEYYVDNLPQGLLLEFMQILFNKNIKNTPRQCNNCHYYFIPMTKKAMYCDLITTNNKSTCKKIVPSKRQSEEIKNDIILSIMAKTTSKYTMRLKRALSNSYPNAIKKCEENSQTWKNYMEIAKLLYKKNTNSISKEKKAKLLQCLQELDKKIDKGEELPCIDDWKTTWIF